jgi:MFS family permease
MTRPSPAEAARSTASYDATQRLVPSSEGGHISVPLAAPEGRVRRSLHGVQARYGHLRNRLTPTRLHAPSLDWLNFLVADVRGALGPYVVVFLVSEQRWDAAAVGLVMTLGGWAGIATQAPIGAWLDRTRHKRGALLGALFVLSLGALIVAFLPSFWPVLIANGIMQIVSGIFEPVVAALTVGLCARAALTPRMGRNAAWARAGNVVVALTSGLVAWLFAPRAVFLQVPMIAALTIIAVMSIPYDQVDQRRARGLKSGENEAGGPGGWLTLLHSRPLLVFGGCSVLFELADAPLLTLVAQKLAVDRPAWGLVITSGCVVTAQMGMLLSAMLVGRRADRWGYRWLLAAGFALLPLRAGLTLLWQDPVWLISLQFLGGLGGGLFAALTPLWLADATQGSGHYNLAQGAMGTLRALGVTTSALAGEFLVHHSGYGAAFMASGMVGAGATVLLWMALPRVGPETTGRLQRI